MELYRASLRNIVFSHLDETSHEDPALATATHTDPTLSASALDPPSSAEHSDAPFINDSATVNPARHQDKILDSIVPGPNVSFPQRKELPSHRSSGTNFLKYVAAAKSASQKSLAGRDPRLPPRSAFQSSKGPSTALGDTLARIELGRLVSHVEAGLFWRANEIKKQLEKRGIDIPWHPIFEQCLINTSPENVRHVKRWLALLPPATSGLVLSPRTRRSVVSLPHNIPSIKEMGLLAASKGYLDLGLGAVRLVVSQEASETSARYVAEWENVAIQSRDVFPVPIVQVLGALYRYGVVDGLSSAGRVDDAQATLAELSSSGSQVYKPSPDIQMRPLQSLPVHSNQPPDSTPLRTHFLQSSFNLVKSVMLLNISRVDDAPDLDALNRLKEMARGSVTIRNARGFLELAIFMRRSGPRAIPHLEALCAQLEHRGSEVAAGFWIAGAMQYLMHERQYAAAVYMYSRYMVPTILQAEIKQAAQTFTPSSSAPAPAPGQRLKPQLTHDSILLHCLIKLCPTPAALDALLDGFRATALTVSRPRPSAAKLAVILTEVLRNAGRTEQLRALLRDVAALPDHPTHWPAVWPPLLRAYAATADVPKVIAVLERMRHGMQSMTGECFAVLRILEDAGCAAVVRTYMHAVLGASPGGAKTRLAAADVPRVLELLRVLEAAGEVPMAGVYVAVTRRFRESDCLEGVRAVEQHITANVSVKSPKKDTDMAPRILDGPRSQPEATTTSAETSNAAPPSNEDTAPEILDRSRSQPEQPHVGSATITSAETSNAAPSSNELPEVPTSNAHSDAPLEVDVAPQSPSQLLEQDLAPLTTTPPITSPVEASEPADVSSEGADANPFSVLSEAAATAPPSDSPAPAAPNTHKDDASSRIPSEPEAAMQGLYQLKHGRLPSIAIPRPLTPPTPETSEAETPASGSRACSDALAHAERKNVPAALAVIDAHAPLLSTRDLVAVMNAFMHAGCPEGALAVEERLWNSRN
ncbi:hypothetical protein B0H17DRAFT_1200998 [Mycena rosella]|uniref:Uncharacterized protein n=1 Tax=Mycena rosella TaxID=1033263 RepID=A0AAD7DIC3_MYCRO|nr:hypothetical protein B0H17DRAFT_1200998 [Mycena rosella]